MNHSDTKTEEYFRALVEASPAATIVVGADGLVRYANPAVERLLGFRPGGLIGEGLVGLVHPEDRERFARELEASAGCLSVPGPGESRLRRADDSWCWIEWTANSLPEHSGVRELLWTGHEVSHRRRIEEELRFLSVLLENTLDAILVADADGAARYVTPSIENLMGYKPEEMLGKRPVDFLHPDDVEQQMSAYNEIASRPGASGYTLARFLHKDGSWRWIEGIGHNMLEHPVIRGMLNSGRDVTRRKEVEDRLRFLSLLVENTLDMIMVADPEGRSLYVNPAHERILGYTAEELKALKVSDLLHPDDYERVTSQISEHARTPGSITGYIEARYRHKDGSWRWIEGVANNTLQDPVVGGIIYCGRDITRRKYAEEEIRRLNETLERRIEERTAQLKKSETQFRAVFEAAAIGMAQLDTSGRYLRVNPRLCEITGHTREQLLARRFQELTHSDDLDTELEFVRELLAGERDTYALEKRLIRRDRSRAWVEQTVSLAGGSLDEVGYLIQVTEDITWRKEAQRILQELTPAEVEVLKRLALGETNQEIAANTKFSFGTVKHRVQQITRKLGVSDRTQAAARAVELGLLFPEERQDRRRPE